MPAASFLKFLNQNDSANNTAADNSYRNAAKHFQRTLAEVSWEKMVELAKANAQHFGGIRSESLAAADLRPSG